MKDLSGETDASRNSLDAWPACGDLLWTSHIPREYLSFNRLLSANIVPEHHIRLVTNSIAASSKRLATPRSKISGSTSTATQPTSARTVQSITPADTSGGMSALRCHLLVYFLRYVTRAACSWMADTSTISR